MSLRAPLHRQYKTARTETHCHLLLKTWQMAIQTSASRGYVLFDIKVAFMPPVVWCRKGHTQSPTNCLPGCGHDPRSAPNLERHGSSKMQTSGWLEIPHFLNRIFPLHFHLKSLCNLLIILLIKPKYDMLIAAVPFIFRIPDQIRDYTYKSYCGRDRPESSAIPLAEALEVDNLPLT